MTDRQFTINRAGCSVCCRLYAPEGREPGSVVLCGHGFGGHKDNRAAARYAEYVISKRMDAAVLSFDWPCHGSDVRRKLLLEDCDLYLSVVLAYVREQYPQARLQAYATSFGGYLFLKYIAEHGNPFEKAALRCPAVPMYEVITGAIMTEENRAQLARGRDALVGFDRKIKVSPELLESIRQADLTRMDFRPYADELLILHGTKDEIVPIAAVEAFAERSGILFFPVENADHRFQDPAKMREAIRLIAEFLE